MKQLVLAVLVLAAPAAAQEKPFDWKLRPEVGSKWRVETLQNGQATFAEINSMESEGNKITISLT